ncbi:retrovirus-related pol polyprotein from transposon TNT 1-94 [Tanacetum coccineum]
MAREPLARATEWIIHILLGTLLGSCSETIQPLISSAETSRSRIISLKSKLTKNPKGTKSIAEYLYEMKSIADALSLAQSLILEEDSVVHILTQLGDEYNNIVAAIKVRESPITFSELFDKLTDFERMLKDNECHGYLIVVSSPSTLHNFSDYGGPDEIFLGDGKSLSISHTGNTTLNTSHRPLHLQDILCVPRDLHTEAPLMRGENHNDVYCAGVSRTPQIHVIVKSSLSRWHHKLGHPSNKVLRSSSRLASSSMSKSDFHCDSCSINKSHKLPFYNNSLVSTKPLELVYTDVWGPTQRSIDGCSKDLPVDIHGFAHTQYPNFTLNQNLVYSLLRNKHNEFITHVRDACLDRSTRVNVENSTTPSSRGAIIIPTPSTLPNHTTHNLLETFSTQNSTENNLTGDHTTIPTSVPNTPVTIRSSPSPVLDTPSVILIITPLHSTRH